MSDTTKPGDPADKAADGAFGGVTSHRAGYGDKLARVEEWLRKHPSATLASGEGAVLLAEIDRLRDEKMALRKELESLRAEVLFKHEDWEFEHAEAVKLRAAIERVRALHAADGHNECPQCLGWSFVDWSPVAYPCHTLRVLDGEDGA